MKKTITILFLGIFSLFFEKVRATEVTQEGSGNKIVVVTDIPGSKISNGTSPYYEVSPHYEISASTSLNGVYLPCFANITKSLQSFSTTKPEYDENTTTQGYFNDLRDWSHTYANIEMSGKMYVKIKRIGSTPAFNASTSLHPARNISRVSLTQTEMILEITNTGQFNIDINNIMSTTNYYQLSNDNVAVPPLHSISIFANPIKNDKPTTGRIFYVDPTPNLNPGEVNTKLPTKAQIDAVDVIYFRPGVHNIDQAYTIYANKQYYIPGDAVVYGTFFNKGASGANIRIHGYGTLSGDKITHPDYNGVTEWNGQKFDDTEAGKRASKEYGHRFRLIFSDQSSNFRVDEVSLMNCPMHTIAMQKTGGEASVGNNVNWVKLITWRVNGDGIGNADNVSNSFLRTQDDATYVRGNRTNLVLWTDINGACFVLASVPTFKISVSNCDVIFARSGSKGWNGGRVFSCRAMGPATTAATQCTFENIRITDPLQTMETFYLVSAVSASDGDRLTGGYTGLTFKNITSVRKLYKDIPNYTLQPAEKNRLSGAGPEGDPKYSWGVTFENVNLGGTLISKKSDFSDNMIPNVNIVFRNTSTSTFTLTTNATSGGSVTGGGTYTSGTTVNNLQATPNSGFIFTGWSGDLSGTSNPGSITMNSNKTVTANFAPITTTFTLTTNATSGGTVSNSGTYNSGTVVNVTATPNSGFRFTGWSGDLSGTSNPGSITMNSNKTVTANFAPITTTFTLTTNATSGGTVSNGGTYNSGTVVAVTATPNSGFRFTGWSGDLSGTSNPGSITMNSNKTVTANFAAINNSPITALTSWSKGIINPKVSGSNRVFVVMVMAESGASSLSATVTYGGQAMTRQIQRFQTSSRGSYAAIFTLLESKINLATNGNIVVSWSNTSGLESVVYSAFYGNVDQSTSLFNSSSNGLNGTAISTQNALTTSVGDVALMCGMNHTNNTVSFTNGFTKQFESNSGFGDAVGGFKLATGSSETPRYTQSSSGRMVICGIILKRANQTSSQLRTSSAALDVQHNEEMIRTQETGEEILIYPNPAKGNLTIKSNELSKKIQFFNVLGQLVHSVDSNKSTTNIDLNASSLKTGTYIIHISSENKKTSHKISIE